MGTQLIIYNAGGNSGNKRTTFNIQTLYRRTLPFPPTQLIPQYLVDELANLKHGLYSTKYTTLES